MNIRTRLLKGLAFTLLFTVFYGVFRLIKQDEWRWDYLAESYAGLWFVFLIWAFFGKDAQSTADTESVAPSLRAGDTRSD